MPLSNQMMAGITFKEDGTIAEKPEFTVEPEGLITVK